MAWVPCIVASRRNRHYRTRGSGIIAALVIFCLLFGVFFFIFFNRMNGFTMPIWIIISSFGTLLLIIGIVMAIVASMSHTYKKSNVSRPNPYHSQPQKQPQKIILILYVIQVKNNLKSHSITRLNEKFL